MNTSLFPIVDYANHPGFAGLGPAKEDPAADAMIAEIEAIYARLCERADISAEHRLHLFDQEVAPQIDTLLHHLGETAAPEFHRFTTNAFLAAKQSLRDYLRVRGRDHLSHNSARKALTSAELSRLESFRRDGFVILQDSAAARDVWSKTWLERALLQTRKRKTPVRHCVMDLPLTSPGRAAVKRAAERLGMHRLAEAYLGRPVEFCYAALDHAHDRQSWHESCYGDIGIDTAKTVYMHFDADCDIIKAMLYLQDVEEKDGPFRFVTGSHHWERPHFATAVQRGFDSASADEFALTGDRLDYVAGYYRPRFKLAEQRRNLLSLPASLRGSTHFGDDLLDGSSLSDSLLEREHAFTGPAGTIVMFDGSHGIHRGGQVKRSGARWAIQIAFRAGTSAKQPLGRRMRWAVKSRLLRMRDILRGLKQLREAA
jgi:hypothetical protein